MWFCFSEQRMTLAELKALVERMQNLPCVMSQLEEVQVSRGPPPGLLTHPTQQPPRISSTVRA